MSAGSQTESSAADPKKIRVLIADDHVIVLEGLAAIIGRQPDMMVAAEAADGQEAVELWIKHHPDVKLLDLRMPKLDGVSAIERIREQDTSAHVILLTTYEADAEILRAIRAGTKEVLQLCSHPVIGWQDAPPGIFGLWFIQVAAI
jgi:DNA-binding NarL/FixJ family response regulator